MFCESNVANLPSTSVVPSNKRDDVISIYDEEKLRKVPSLNRAFALEQVFEFDDQLETHLDSDDVDLAYTSIKKKIDFGKDLIYARELVRFYKVAMLSKHSERGAKICRELVPLIRLNTLTKPDDIEGYARKLELRNRFFEAILFFQIAATFYLDDVISREDAIAGVTVCCEGVRNASKNLLRHNNDLKSLVRHHILPILVELHREVCHVSSNDVSSVLRVNYEVKCLHCIEYIEGRVGDNEGRETTLRNAISIIESRLGSDCSRFGVYSLLLNNLGCVFEITDRFEDARIFYAKAIIAHQSAEDYQDENQRKFDVDSSRRALNRVQNKMKKIYDINTRK